jgi:hypothetical protein
VAYEEMYRSYRGVIAKAIEDLRPHLQVRSVALGGIEEALARFDPHVGDRSCPSASVNCTLASSVDDREQVLSDACFVTRIGDA